MDLLLDVVKYECMPSLKKGSESELRKGVASNFLIQLPIGGKFLSYHESNSQFRMSNNLNRPILMICTGSGIAPFR